MVSKGGCYQTRCHLLGAQGHCSTQRPSQPLQRIGWSYQVLTIPSSGQGTSKVPLGMGQSLRRVGKASRGAPTQSFWSPSNLPMQSYLERG